MQLVIILFLTVFLAYVKGQTIEQRSNYYCGINNYGVEFTLTQASHSAWEPISNCSLQQCYTNLNNNNNCHSSVHMPCFGYRTHDNIRYCAPGITCAILEPCNNTTYACSMSASVCVINSCCSPQAVCLPLSLRTFCVLECGSMFTSVTTYTAHRNPSSIHTYDFNGDSLLDLVVANVGNNTIGIYLGYGNGSFADVVNYPVGNNPNSIAVSDFNNDGWLDLAVLNFYSSNIGILLGDGNGGFGAQTTFPTSSASLPITVADVNDDNNIDLVILTGSTVNMYLGYGNGGFSAQPISILNIPAVAIVLTDLNNDGHLDLITAGTSYNSLSIFAGHGNGSFTLHAILSSLGSNGIVAGDFNNDNQIDFVGSNPNNDTVSVFFGFGNLTFEIQGIYRTDTYPLLPIVGDFNNDNNLDFIIPHRGNNTLAVFIGYGNGTFIKQTIWINETGPVISIETAVGDFNGDHKLDLVTSNFFTDIINIFLNTCQ